MNFKCFKFDRSVLSNYVCSSSSRRRSFSTGRLTADDGLIGGELKMSGIIYNSTEAH